MTETEFINAANLTKLRAARSIVDLYVTCELNERDRAGLDAHIYGLIRRLEAVVEVNDWSDDPDEVEEAE